MSESRLPDDISRWPSDPYRLLDVPRSIDERELKRAYLKLVRQYKPEQAPEAFQKIRHAYETIQRWLNQGARWYQDDDSDSSDESGTDEIEVSDDHATTGPKISTLSGREAMVEAYTQLANEFEANPRSRDTHLKLYWLLVAIPDLDANRKPIDWLYLALAAKNGSCAASYELVRRAVEADPSLAFGELPKTLLGPSIDPSFISVFVELRWRAARILGFGNVIRADIHQLRDRSHRELEEQWPSLLLLAIRQYVWIEKTDQLSETRGLMREIEGWGVDRKSINDALYEIDVLIDRADEAKALSNAGDLGIMLSRLLPKLSDPSSDRAEQILRPFFDRLSNDLTAGLRFLDRLVQYQPSVFVLLIGVVDSIYSGAPLRDAEAILRPLRAFIKGTNWNSYNDVRFALLRFCVQEGIEPNDVGTLVSRPQWFSQNIIEQIAPHISNDHALRYAYRIWVVSRTAIS